MDVIREQAKQDYMNKLTYKEICSKHDLSINTLKSWIKRYGWSDERKRLKNKGAPKKKRGAPLNNKNAVGNVGGSAPAGNLNAIKHGAYQSIYADMLSDEDKALYENIGATVDVDEEIRLLRLKIARLLNRKQTFVYDMFGKKHDMDITEEARTVGINACMDQLRKLIETKATTLGSTEKLQLDKDKFEFQKYRTEIELQLKKDKLELEKAKIFGEDEEFEDDGFIDALKGQVSEVWDESEEG